MNLKPTATAFISTLIFGLALFTGMRIAGAARVWFDPSASPTAGNLPIPLHTGAGSQIKSGGLSVNTFFAAKNAQFDQQVFFRKPIHGGTPAAAAPLRIGGIDLSGKTHTVQTVVSSTAHMDGTLGAAELASAAKQTVCGDQDGHIVLCSQITTSPSKPKDIYGSVVEWCDNGNPRLKFSFNAATPVALHMNLAMCTATYWDSSKVACWGTDLLNTVGEQRPWPSPSGDINSQHFSRPGAFTITIPAGTTTYTTPDLWQNGEKAFCRTSGKLLEGIQYGYGTKYPQPQYYTLLLKMLNNTDYTLHLSGSTMYRSDPKYNSFTPIIIK